MAVPSLVTAVLFRFIVAWNDFLFALLLTMDEAITLTMGLARFQAKGATATSGTCRPQR